MITETAYIYPPRTETCLPRDQDSFLTGWLGQPKYNGTRCLIKITPQRIELWSRHAEKIKNYTPTENVTEQLHNLRTLYNLDNNHITIFDSELLDSKHTAIKNTIAIFDILVHNSQHLTGTTYSNRYNTLINPLDYNHDWMYTNPINPTIHPPQNFGIYVSDSIFVPRNWTQQQWPQLWEMVETVNRPYTDKTGNIKPVLEGIVYKDPHGVLKPGYKMKNNEDWQMKSRVATARHKF